MQFKDFLLNENKAYFGSKVNNILSALHDLQEDSPNIGTRQLMRLSTNIVDQIRNILHTSWNQNEQKYLKELQKIGVFIMKTIDDKGDLREVLDNITSNLENMVGDIGIPANKIQP